jgi:hypothetical protein
MKKHAFTIVLQGVAELTEELETALYEAGCDDALVWKSQGKVGLDFIRAAESKSEAIQSAIKDIKRAGIRETEMV